MTDLEIDIEDTHYWKKQNAMKRKSQTLSESHTGFTYGRYILIF